MRKMFVICSLALMPLSAHAQQETNSATVSGQVTDSSGAPVADAQVTIKSLASNRTLSARSDNSGLYRFARLDPGPWTLSAVKPGFATMQRNVDLTGGSAFDIPFRLEIAARIDSTQVITSAPLIDTARTEIGETIRQSEIDQLPVDNRNFYSLALLGPGDQTPNIAGNTAYATTSAIPGLGLSISAQRNLANNYLVDGFASNDDAAGLAGTYFGLDTIREFQVITSNATAEFGRETGGAINIITRSGSNDFHGTAYGYLKNQRFNAANPLSHSLLPLTQMQYGASLSGPVQHDKTFFFSNFEQTNQQTAGVITVTPANVAAINTALTSFHYQGPLATTGAYPTTLHTTNYLGRVDHEFSARDQFMLRYNFYHLDTVNLQGAGGLSVLSRGTNLGTNDSTVALANYWTISPHTYNETRVQYFNSNFVAPPATTIGPAISISGVANLGPTNVFPTGRYTEEAELSNNTTWERGRHSIKAGVDFIYNNIDIYAPGLITGSYSFSSLASFQTGNYSAFSQDFGSPKTSQRNPNLGLFVTDEWRATPNLTFNIGLRYDLEFLPQTVATDRKTLQPRAGFAWSPWGNRKTVIRGSFGIYEGRIPLRITSLVLQRNGINLQSVSSLAPSAAGSPVFPNLLPAFPSGLLFAIMAIQHNIPVGSSNQGSVQVEHELTNDLSLSVGYNHLRGLHIIGSHGINVPTCTTGYDLCRPNTQYANIDQYSGLGDSWYDGMTATLRTRPTRLGMARLSYTWSHAIDDLSQSFQGQPMIPNNVWADRGNSDDDQRHRLVTSWELHSPSRPATTAWEHITHGYLLGTTFSCGSALPLNALTGTTVNSYGNIRPVGAARNSLRGFGSQSLNTRLSRTFALTEKYSLQALIEGLNLLNHPNYLLPNTTFGTGPYPQSPLPTFGQPTAVGNPRQLQFALRLNF